MSKADVKPSFQGLTSPLWPIRYKPLPDELLSCWLVRLAHGHGLKVQTFCNLLFGHEFQVWNRDIDRLAPPRLLNALALHTGTPDDIVRRTTLRVFDGVLYSRFRQSGHLNWILTMQMYHRKRQGTGQQYCPACLASDPTPYFRKTWRLALWTFCAEHQCQLLDQCWHCHAPVSFHRMDMGQAALTDDPLSLCYACRSDLASGPRVQPAVFDEEAFNQLSILLREIDRLSRDGRHHAQAITFCHAPIIESLPVLRHLVGLTLSRRKAVHLRRYLAELFGAPDPIELLVGRPSIEAQPNAIRHALIQWTAWMLCDPRSRLIQALRDHALRFNHLLKDFEAPPHWYVGDVVAFAERLLPTWDRRWTKQNTS